jgi:hypothetical protein
VSQPEQPPRFFLDRSLGRKAVPEALRADGWDVITLAEHYGIPADENIADTEWIEEAAQRGWAILMKDKRIRHSRTALPVAARAAADLSDYRVARRTFVARRCRSCIGFWLHSGLGHMGFKSLGIQAPGFRERLRARQRLRASLPRPSRRVR